MYFFLHACVLLFKSSASCGQLFFCCEKIRLTIHMLYYYVIIDIFAEKDFNTYLNVLTKIELLLYHENKNGDYI